MLRGINFGIEYTTEHLLTLPRRGNDVAPLSQSLSHGVERGLNSKGLVLRSVVTRCTFAPKTLEIPLRSDIRVPSPRRGRGTGRGERIGKGEKPESMPGTRVGRR